MGVAFSLYRKYDVPMMLRGANHPANDTLLCAEWAILIVLTLILGPQTTPRHMVMLLPAYALAAAFLLAPVPKLSKLPLLLATILLFLSLILPTGGESLNIWRTIAGPSICAVMFCFALLHTALGYAEKRNETTGDTESRETAAQKPL
jgi:hypothetical protein